MDKALYEILDNINEGIIILNENLRVLFWNNHMEHLTNISEEKIINNHIYDVIPSLNKGYFKQAIDSVINNGSKMFFSAAMHKNLIDSNRNLNLKISKINMNNLNYILMEFIDVTNQFLRIEQLKKYIDELYFLNKELKEKEKTINKLAYYDSLTGIANRNLFYNIAEKFFINAKRNNGLLGLMFIDVDKFKSINDTYGHKSGDEALIHVSKILKRSIRRGDVVARFGGDEFVILLSFIKSYDDSKLIASRIITPKNKTLNCREGKISVSLSIGLSLFPYDGQNIDELVRKADKAMYVAKNKGGDNYFSFL